MSRASRLLVIAAAWLAPTAWIAAALLSGPSDGTRVSPGAGVAPGRPWGTTLLVVQTYGDTTLTVGDEVLTIGGLRPGASAPARDVGDTVSYVVERRSEAGLDVELSIPVTLGRYDAAAVASHHAGSLVAAAMLLAAGSVVFWRRSQTTTARAFLVASALVPAGLTVDVFGPSAIDLGGGRGSWPILAGIAITALGMASAVLATAAFVPARLSRATRAALTTLPLVAAGVCIVVLDRLGRLPSLTPPAIVGAVAVLTLLGIGYRRADDRPSRLAVRLALIGVGGGVAARAILGHLAELVSGEPLLPWEVLAVLVAPLSLACVVAAVVGYRLEEVEPAVRRASVQGLVAALVAGAFVAVAAAVGSAAGVEVGSLLAGGVVALLVLPLALLLQRSVRARLYGDRDLPRRVVTDLRRLDPTNAPEEAMRESLTLLARRLRLSYAAIEVVGNGRHDAVITAIGDARGDPTTVELVVGDTRLGRLLLEVSEERDPFGPGDRRLLEDVGAQVGTLVQAVTLSSELQQSRQRLVAAQEEERRRLRRDLHDGLGPSLASLAMRLETARDLIAEDPAQAADLVGRLSERAREEITEVRRLVEGLRPPALDQLGLVTALRQRADEHNATAIDRVGRPALTWTVEADELDPLPAAVEVAAYRIVLEAVTNATRHSAAASCAVTLRRQDGWLRVTVQDSGQGLAEDPRLGVGLSSMRERAEELGGTCTVTSGAGTGTVVEARLPLTAGDAHDQ